MVTIEKPVARPQRVAALFVAVMSQRQGIPRSCNSTLVGCVDGGGRIVLQRGCKPLIGLASDGLGFAASPLISHERG
jgi:hypothetical protein